MLLGLLGLLGVLGLGLAALAEAGAHQDDDADGRRGAQSDAKHQRQAADTASNTPQCTCTFPILKELYET